jgi:hypothetical protein
LAGGEWRELWGRPEIGKKSWIFPEVGQGPLFFMLENILFKMEWDQIPKRVFLDTSVLNFIFDYGEYIFDGLVPPESLNHYIIKDINALHNVFLTGKRASWQIAISHLTFEEILKTRCLEKRYHLKNWFFEVWNYWLEVLNNNKNEFLYRDEFYLKEYLLSKDFVKCLPDKEDRELICDAVIFRCDYFCTRDWKTILRHREKLKLIPIKIVTPEEWWHLIYPFAGLFA